MNYLRQMWYRLRQNPILMVFLGLMLFRMLFSGGIGGVLDWFVETLMMLPAT